MKANFLVTLTLPNGVSIQRMRRYIEEAVKTMKGTYEPDDPLFELRRESVRVQMLGVKQ